VLPVLCDLVFADLRGADASEYRHAARRLRRMRQLAGGSGDGPDNEFDELIASLRDEHRRRPWLQREFDGDDT